MLLVLSVCTCCARCESRNKSTADAVGASGVWQPRGDGGSGLHIRLERRFIKPHLHENALAKQIHLDTERRVMFRRGSSEPSRQVQQVA
jgi:hypothetical protein